MIHPRHAHRVRRLRRLATIMDSSIGLPGTRFRIGIDPIIGLVPGVGDLAGAVVSAYIVSEAARMGVGKRALARMTGNILLEVFVGAIPLIGDVFDATFKANRRNVRHIEREFERGRLRSPDTDLPEPRPARLAPERP